MAGKTGDNLKRLMANLGLNVEDLVQKTGMDRRTIAGLLDGSNNPHCKTIGRLAEGLGVSADEFFVETAQLTYRQFDRQTNPVVADVVNAHSEIFSGWTPPDFEELHSRFGTGGALTAQGTLEVAREMNAKRALIEKFALLLESSHADVVSTMVETFYAKFVLTDKIG